MMEHRANQAATASDALVESDARSYKLQSKVREVESFEFLLLRFRNL